MQQRAARRSELSEPADARDAGLTELNNRLFFRLFQTANVMHHRGTRALAPLGVTTQQWSVLGALSRPQARDGMSVGELCAYLAVSRQNLTGILGRLERAGRVERLAGSDRRTRRVRLTAAGRELWEALQPRIYEFYDDALDGLSFDDRVALVHLLNRLRENMKNIT